MGFKSELRLQKVNDAGKPRKSVGHKTTAPRITQGGCVTERSGAPHTDPKVNSFRYTVSCYSSFRYVSVASVVEKGVPREIVGHKTTDP